MRINQNIMAFNAYRNLSATNTQLGKSLEKLSSGFRINRAADDAAGLVVSEGLRAQVSGLRVAVRNAQDGTSVVQTAEGALTEVHSMLRRMRDLVLQASNTGANDDDARAAAQAEIDQLVREIDRVSTDTKFGQVALLDGTYGAAATAGVASAATVTGSFALDLDVSQVGTTFSFELSTDGGVAEGGQAGIVSVTGEDWSATGVANFQSDLQAAVNAAVGAGLVTVAASVNGNNEVQISLTRAGAGSTAIGNSIQLANTTGNTHLATLGLTAATTTGAVTTPASAGGGLFQVGANAGETISVAVTSMRAHALGLADTDLNTTGVVTLDVETDDTSREDALTALDSAIEAVSDLRGDLGAIQNRFEHTIANLSVTAENLAASESRIRDTDMALELVDFTRHQILQQAGTAMLAQANQVPSSVLSLLG